MALGVLAGLLAGAFWGLTFVAPLAVAPFTTLDLTIVRFAAYGALSSPSFLALWRAKLLTRDLLFRSILLSAAGFIGYFILMAIAVTLSGVAVVALVVGTLPLIIALLGDHGDRRITPAQLAAPLTLIGLGLLIVNIEAIQHLLQARPDSLPRFALGVVLVTAATALWAWYALANARWMKNYAHISSAQWSALQGVGCLILLPLVALLAIATGDTRWRDLGVNAASLNFIAWGLTIGALASSVAMWLWALASRRLPVALCGMLIVSETVFAVLYGAMYAGRAPTLPEIAATALLALGVILGVRAFADRSTAPEAAI